MASLNSKSPEGVSTPTAGEAPTSAAQAFEQAVSQGSAVLGNPGEPPAASLPSTTRLASSSASGSGGGGVLAPERVPSKSQQLLNKLKIGRKTTPSQTAQQLLAAGGGSSSLTGGGTNSSNTPTAAGQAGRSSFEWHGSTSSTQAPSGPSGIGNPSQSQASWTFNKAAESDELREELSPQTSAPTNPLAPLLTPFRIMKPLMPAVATRATAAAVAGIKKPWSRRIPSAISTSAGSSSRGGELAGAGLEPVVVSSPTDSCPPMGYLWLWMGRFRRWQKRFIVASEAPGVLLIYKRMNMKGKVLSISLRNVQIQEDPSHSSQFMIITPTGHIFLRSVVSEERGLWLACLRESVRLYLENQAMVEKLKDEGLLLSNQLGPGDLLMGTPRLASPNVPTGIALPEVADMDVEQRRRIRARLAEKLSEISPYQKEVERHLGALSSQLLAVVSGLNVRVHSLTPNNSINPHVAIGQGGAAAGRPPRPPAGPSNLSAVQTKPSFLAEHGPDGQLPGGSQLPQSPAAAGASDMSLLSDASRLGAPVSSPKFSSLEQGPVSSRSALLDAHQPSPESSTLEPLDSVRAFPGATQTQKTSAWGGGNTALPERAISATLKAHMRPAPVKAANLQQAFGQLLEAVRYSFHSQAVRIAQLEIENSAMQAALKQERLKRMRSTSHTHISSAGGVSQPGVKGSSRASPVRQATGEAAAVRSALDSLTDTLTSDEEDEEEVGEGSEEEEEEEEVVGGGDDEAAVSADEDAFDVTEPFEGGAGHHGVNRSGEEDRALGPEGQGGAHRRGASPGEAGLHRSSLVGAGSKRPAQATGAGNLVSPEAEVLNALEVVRQVEYVEKLKGAELLSKVLASDEPPDAPPNEGDVAGFADSNDDDDDEDDDEEEVDGAVASDKGASHGGRSCLPAARPLGKGFSIWSLLKNMIGKDLTRLTMPATVNEPTSTLQRLAEVLEYRSLLHQAAAEPKSIDRLMLVAVWNLSCYSSQTLRDGKPFNPLLGETYEWRSHDGDARYFCEQVSHHPPVLAYIADSAKGGWSLQGELETKSKFWGKSVEVMLSGCEALSFKQWGDEFRWNRATICVNDVILGNYWIETYGKIRVKNASTGETAMITLKPCRRRMADRGKLEGSVMDAQGNEVWQLSGSTADRIYAQLTPSAAAARGMASTPPPQLIFEKAPYPPNAAEQYWFTRFAIGVNDPSDRIVPDLPPTDTRFRPDQRALEVGEWNRATTEKLRLEEKQRQARRERAKQGIPYHPAWFKHVDAAALTHVPDQPGFAWSFTGEYWKRQATRDWQGCLDLYSAGQSVIVPKVGAQPPSP